jgi:two-component system OmpR family sensor kinase/two-component system phosphate regulon sensor histidine kinase PhoR
MRPEIIGAHYESYGTNLRVSGTTKHEYLYFARRFDAYYVRVALPYSTHTRQMLEADNSFVWLSLLLFVMAIFVVNVAAGRFSRSLQYLRRLASSIKKGTPLPPAVGYPNDELGSLGRELLEIFNKMEAVRKHSEIERQKLIRHVQFSGEGLCIFNKNMKKVYANANFMQYLSLIADQPAFEAEEVLSLPPFQSIAEFINDKHRLQNHAEFHINKNARIFAVQTVVFQDSSFEISIEDVTQAEQTRFLKQEMSANIAHELRTPVSSLRAYLETLSTKEMDSEKREQFTERAYLQTLRLSQLIDDVSFISKMENVPTQFVREPLHIAQIVNEARIDLSARMEAEQIKFFSEIPLPLIIYGNYNLLYAVFRNLIENSINHGGRGVEIHLSQYAEDEYFYYFSYYDTGAGVDEIHLGRIFERFYRADKGRSRSTGGSGLGLAIIKNAILLHNGKIEAKNRPSAGMEFLFTLPKGVW